MLAKYEFRFLQAVFYKGEKNLDAIGQVTFTRDIFVQNDHGQFVYHQGLSYLSLKDAPIALDVMITENNQAISTLANAVHNVLSDGAAKLKITLM